MKKLLILTSILFAFNHSYSQTINIIPDTGNVVLGGDTSSVKLKVCGSTVIDSNLTVKEQIKAENDLRVDGNVYLNGDLFFTGGITTITDFSKIALFGPNGELRGGSPFGLTPLMYQEDCIPFTDINGNVSAYPAPVWQAVPGPNYGILHTGTHCPARVGIGISNPLTDLDVAGNFHSSYNVGIGDYPQQGTALYIKEFNNNLPTTTLIQAEGSTGNFVLKNNGEIIQNVSSSGYGLTIDNANATGQGLYIESGDGTTQPSSNFGLINVVYNNKQVFYVDGKNSITYAREVKVNTNATWPDYVFEENYVRMTPEEKEAYFKLNKHLPGIPNAAEVEENGIPVSATLNGLTRNVEENSLDINMLFIELQKLKEENEKLRKEMEELKNK